MILLSARSLAIGHGIETATKTRPTSSSETKPARKAKRVQPAPAAKVAGSVKPKAAAVGTAKHLAATIGE